MAETVTTIRRRGRPPIVGGEGSGDVQSVDRTVTLLDILSTGDGATLSEIGRRAELPTSTVHRLLTTLHRRGLVGHDPGTGLWTVGVGLFRIGAAYLRIRKLPDIARPVIRDLLATVGETVNVSKLDEGELVCVAQAESHAPVRAFFRLGRRMPIHASAGGKAILAASEPEGRDRLLSGLSLERFTINTRNTRKSLLSDLAGVTERGWAIDDEEHTEGMRCVAAAISNEWLEPVGAISISAPTVRMAAERIEALGPLVREAADRLSYMYAGAIARPPDGT